MDNLIAALTILSKYITDNYLKSFPTSCDHDVFRVYADPAHVSPEDMDTLHELGFMPDRNLNCFYSTLYGSN